MNPKERLDTILAALEKLVAEHGPSYVAGATTGLMIKSRAFSDEMQRSAFIGFMQVLESAAQHCQCENCKAKRAQA